MAILPSTTAMELAQDRFAQVKAIIAANPGLSVTVRNGLNISLTHPGVELRVTLSGNTLDVRIE